MREQREVSQATVSACRMPRDRELVLSGKVPNGGGWGRQNFSPGPLGKAIEGTEWVRGQKNIRHRKQDMFQHLEVVWDRC